MSFRRFLGKEKVFLAISLLFLILTLGAEGVEGQISGPRLFMTWEAKTYVPPGFLGRALPNKNSLVLAGLEVLDSQGKVQSIPNNEIYWYLDDRFIEGGPGLKQISFRLNSIGQHLLRAKVVLNDQTLDETITVTAVRPEVVIEAPYPGNNFSDPRIRVSGFPYFFNAANLSQLDFDWRVGGVKINPQSNPDVLNLILSPIPQTSTEFEVVLNVRSSRDPLEVGSKALKLNFIK